MPKVIRKNYSTGSAYKVDKKIPLPRKKVDLTRFPFDKMKMGDSFLIPVKDQPRDKARASVFTAVKSFNTHNSKTHKISTRNEKGGLRIWRIK